MKSGPWHPTNKYQGRRYADLWLWLVYLLLALLLTWPSVTHLTTHLPGDGGDDPAIAWNLWWVKYALLNQGQNPFQTDFMFYPIGINLAFYTLTVLNAVTALPVALNFGVVTASNLHTLFTFVVGGYGTFLLARYCLLLTTNSRLGIGGRRSAVGDHIWISAAIAGGFYAFASSKLFYVALGQFNIASNHWVPWAVLYILRTRHNPRRLKNALLAGLFLTMQAWAEVTYATFLLIFIGLYWLYWLIAPDERPTTKDEGDTTKPGNRGPGIRAHGQALLVMGLTLTIGLSPILAQMLPDMRVEGDFLVEGSGFADVFSADLLGFIIPTMHHPWLGHLIEQTNIGKPGSATGFNKGQHIYIGFILLGLLIISILTGYRRPAIRFWLIATVVFALLCLGPVISINGHPTGIPGPFILLQQLPFFKGNRYPSRYSVMLWLSLSVLAGFALVQIGNRFTPKNNDVSKNLPSKQNVLRVVYSVRTRQYAIRTPYLALLLITFVFLLEHLSLPLPQSDLCLPAAYQIIAADPDDFTVLDIPFAWRNGFRITGALTTQFMFGQFYQSTHQKRLLQGNTSRNPEFKFQYFTNAPIINSLLALETGKTLPPEQWHTDKAIAAGALRFFNIKYIIVRPDPTNNPNVTPQATISYIDTVLPVEKIHDEAEIKIYKVKENSPEEPGLLIDTDLPLAPLYFGEGWGFLSPGRPIAAQRKEVRLLLPLTDTAQQLTLRVRLPQGDRDLFQSVSVELNNWQSPAQTVSEDWQELTFDLPANASQPGLNDVRLHFAEVMSLPHPQPGQLPQDVTVLSAGEEVGDFGHIFVNGYDVSPNQRGYNIALLQTSRHNLTTGNFDTHLDPTTSFALADFISTAPPKALIAIAAADEASASLDETAVRALQALGATGDLRGCFRCSHALIYDPASGATLEALDPLRPVGVTTGLGLTEPNVAALVDWIRVDPVAE